MESNEQTELTRAMETESQMESRMTAGVGRLGGGGIDKKGKRTHGHGQQCGDCWREAVIRGLNGNGKNTVKIFFLSAGGSGISFCPLETVFMDHLRRL